MNNLSWFIYLAELIPSIRGSIIIWAFLAIILLAIYSLFIGHKIDMAYHNDDDNYRDTLKSRLASVLKKAVVTIIVLWTVAILLPSKQTLYMIAASEVGEKVATSPQAQEIMKDISAVLKKQLEELKK